jgi:hypothetical protein
MRRPERVGIEGRVSVCDDRDDRALDARRIPRLVAERLELGGFEEQCA